jgi:aminomethyltransferase
MVAFGGWEMPLRFPTGTLAEHLACRQAAAVFDVSHLGTVRLEGPHAWAQLQGALTNDLAKVSPGRAQYTHLLDEDGSVLDDMIVWWVCDERFDVMPNASNTRRVRAALGGLDVTTERAVVAVQGPAARQVLLRAFPAAAEVGHFQVRQLNWGRPAVPTVVAGTGYTGEDGVEVAVPAEAATELWEALVAAGAVPAGLGARDTLRLEAGLPLHGHELGPGTSPLEAGLSWVVAWGKPGGFRGLPALLERRAKGVSRKLTGVIGDGRQPFREGYTVHLEPLEPGAVGACPEARPSPEAPAGSSAKPGPAAWPGALDAPTAELTSGNYSPVLQKGIGLCFLPVEVSPGSRVSVQGRLPATVVKPPFVAKGRAQPSRVSGLGAAPSAATEKPTELAGQS